MHTVKWLQILQSYTNSFICSELNAFRYCYISRRIQFNICHLLGKWLNNSIQLIDVTLTSTTTPGQSGPGSNNDEAVLYIPHSSRTEATASDGFVSYPGHTYPSAKMQSVYSAASVDRAFLFGSSIPSTVSLLFLFIHKQHSTFFNPKSHSYILVVYSFVCML